MRRTLMSAVGGLVLLAGPLLGQQVDWQYPTLDYGPVVPIPETTAAIEDGATYRVVFNVTEAEPGDGRVSSDLALVARFVNLLALSEMEPSDAELVAVVHGSATAAVVVDAAYRERYGTDNPNAPLITDLVNHGVEVVVCGQALAGAGFSHEALQGGVDLAISAMTALARHQLDGYALIP